MASSKHLQATGYSIASKIFVQILSRGFTFVLGAITLKYLQSSALLGIINVRLALLFTTLQFMSREPLRRACLGEAAKREKKDWQRIANTIWLGLPMSFLLAIPLSSIWLGNTPSVEDLAGTSIRDYHNAVLIYCLSVTVEMLAEPCFILAQARAISDHNPKVEVVIMVVRCTTAAAVTVLESSRYRTTDSSNILTKIALCQLFASLVSVVYSYSHLCATQNLSISKFLPSIKISEGIKNLDEPSLKLTLGFISQTFLKQFLTEGERYVMTFFNVITLSEQGIYDVINNLGSLTARLVLKPIEDSGFTLFSQTVSRTETLDIRKFYRVQENLMNLVKSVLVISLMVLTLGYNFVPLIVIYGGDKLNNSLAFYLMRWQLFYTPFLALNGITECFTFAIMNTSELRNYNSCLILLSMVFLVSIYLTQPVLGSASFIFSNCLIMVSRILYSFKLIQVYFERHGYTLIIQNMFPSLTTFISLGGAFMILNISQHYMLDLTQPLLLLSGVALGFWCLIFIMHVIMCHEDDLVRFLSRLFKF